MGNSTSQSVMLAPGTRSLGHSIVPASRYDRSPARYAHPNNRVLPKPIAGQRLRSTDNGHILHSAGTIRGRKSTSPTPLDPDEADPQVADILRKRSEMIERDHEASNLRGYRMFHSDTDISQSRLTNGYSPEVPETLSSRRTGGGVASKANKLKQRKKTRAPEPPPNDSFQSQFQRRSHSTTDLTRERNGGDCICTQDWKSKRAPPPPPPPLGHSSLPSSLVHSPQPSHIPHPPPLPIKTDAAKQQLRDFKTSPEASISVDRPNKHSSSAYSRNHPENHGNISRSVGDLRSADEPRTTVFDSKADLSRSSNKPALISQQPDPFQKEIEAVTRKIARGRDPVAEPSTSTASPQQKEEPQKVISPKQYYFSDRDVFKSDSPKKQSSVTPTKAVSKSSDIQIRPLSTSNRELNDAPKCDRGLDRNSESPLQRFSPNRRRLKSPMKSGNEEIKSNGDRNYRKSPPYDIGSDIDLRLRPILPRKTPETTQFSPLEAWQALGSNGHNSPNRSTSDDSMHYNNHGGLERHQRQYNGYSSRIDDQVNYNYSMNGNQWTPRQDLEDSDTSSLNSDDAVIPKSKLGEFSTRFSLPTVMFSNMRPIGADISASRRSMHNYRDFYPDRSQMDNHMKRKGYKGAFPNSDINASSHFRKFLGMRNKYMTEDDVCVSDSNWTFGGCGLQQKRGKQYSSDLMLSDKKKYELMVQNNMGYYLGDIMLTKADDIKRNGRHKNDISFYSTEGPVMYLPHSKDYDNCSTGSRNAYIKNGQSPQLIKSKKYKKVSEFEKSTSHDLIRMLEDDARRRRSKEKMCIRKQLQLMKRLNSEDAETEEEVDEAYFTEPKSLDGSSPLYFPSRNMRYFPDSPTQVLEQRGAPSLTHWTSSPALLDIVEKSPASGFLSSSSITSSPDPSPWQKPSNVADRWLQKKQQGLNRRFPDKQRRVSEGDSSPILCRRENGEKKANPPPKDQRKMPSGQVKEKKTSIYKQLMDIVRKEERAMKREQGEAYEPSASRESSYSQRESSHSSSQDSVSSSSYSDSSGQGSPRDYGGKSGVPANKEFHAATNMGGIQRSPGPPHGKSPQPFHAQPFGSGKSYRPVPFDVSVPSASGNCRMPTLQEGHKLQAEVLS